MKLLMTVILTKEEVLNAFTDYLERQTRYDYHSPLNGLAVVDCQQRDGEVVLKLEEPQPEEPVETVPAAEADPANANQEAARLRHELEELMGKAAEFIEPDENNKPSCSWCHMELDERLKGHRQNCLADAIMQVQLDTKAEAGGKP